MSTSMRRMTVSLPTEVAADLAYLAYRFGKPKSEVLRDILGDALAQMRLVLFQVSSPIDQLTPAERVEYLRQCSAMLDRATSEAQQSSASIAQAVRGAIDG